MCRINELPFRKQDIGNKGNRLRDKARYKKKRDRAQNEHPGRTLIWRCAYRVTAHMPMTSAEPGIRQNSICTETLSTSAL